MDVVIHADDLGMSAEVDAAIAGLWQRGKIGAVSVLANGPTSAAALAWLAGQPAFEAGVHLDGGAFPPLGGARGPSVDDIAREWRAQLARVREVGIHVRWLDSHESLHFRGAHRDAMAILVQETGLPARAMGSAPGWWRVRSRLRAAACNRALARTYAARDLETWLAEGRPALRGTADPRGHVIVHPGNPAHARYAEEVGRVEGGEISP
jgi:predicted glycoside hydrolase/deacetylase ChbG (UPF0249 family)